MAEATAADVARHFMSLLAQLRLDGFGKDHHVMSTALRLRDALREDGFLIDLSDEVFAVDEDSVESPEPKVFALRVASSLDAQILENLFQSFEGWAVLSLARGTNHYVVVSNHPVVEAEVQTALREYLRKAKGE